MNVLTKSCKNLMKELKANVIYTITNDIDFVKEIVKTFKNTKIIVATNNKLILEEVPEDKAIFKRLSERMIIDVDVLNRVEDLLMSACIEELLEENDVVICLVQSRINAIITFQVTDIGLTHLKQSLQDRIDMKILDIVITLSYEIAREGREGRRIGSLFILGDSENVLKNSRQLIINPFKGHTEEERNILNSENWETIKEFAQLDGAFVIDEKGVAVSTGRYVGVSWDIYLQGGLGGRHLAAASISKTTKAIAITVSTSGIIRIFKDGKELFKMSAI
ncbi:MAG: diadenylate cyclase [Thermoplasmata archaeon]|nr:MAG: diadenylate cyclase [Thermoplasmata archaeon]